MAETVDRTKKRVRVTMYREALFSRLPVLDATLDRLAVANSSLAAFSAVLPRVAQPPAVALRVRWVLAPLRWLVASVARLRNSPTTSTTITNVQWNWTT